MEPRPAKLIFIFATISLIALLLILWIADFSNLNLPEFVAASGIRTYGLLVFASFLAILIFFQKQVLRANPMTSLAVLINSSALICFSSMFIYQGTRQLFILDRELLESLTDILKSTFFSTIVFMIVAASIALELKKVKGIWKHVPTILLIMVLFLLKAYAPTLEW